MEMKRMFVQVVNLTEGKVFSLPTLYTDRTEACVGGQNYIRDRQAENHSELIFFRILDVCPDGTVAPPYELWDDEDEDDPVCGDCDHDCQFCPTNYKVEEEDEEPEHGESVYRDTEEPDWRDFCKDEEFINYFINLMKKV